MKPEDVKACQKLWKYQDFMDRTSEFQGLDREKLKQMMPQMVKILMDRREKDPLIMYERIIEEIRKIWTASESMPVHGGWHHFLVPGILMQALRNNGYDFTEEDVKEAMERGRMIPGGGCGFQGVCGAGGAVGIVLSIVERSNPVHKEERSRALMGTSEAYKRIARIGGSRCCPLSTYTALNLGAKVLEDMGYKLELSKLSRRCTFSTLNDECHGPTCPYYPRPPSNRSKPS
jgi:hypothetical protein